VGARELVGDDGARGYMVPNPLGDPTVVVTTDNMRQARYTRQVNHDALVDAMTALVRDRHRWTAAREQLRKEAATLFDGDVCARRYADALIRVARGQPLRSSESSGGWPVSSGVVVPGQPPSPSPEVTC
jgi:glycosyltransferase involved in cell wall biosynthesis